MQYISFSKNKLEISKDIILPFSKSESNRALIIKAISELDFKINNLSDAEDTILLTDLLLKIKNRNDFKNIETLNAGNAGTVMRFLSAFLCIKRGKWLLTGNERMQQRPIKALVDGLNQIGAGITYNNHEGFPPIIIEGQRINTSILKIDASISSQFISALLMISPYLNEGLIINFKEKVVSKPYIEMTLKIMHYFGINYQFNEESILIAHQNYKAKDITINYDWSAASYFYEIIALSPQGTELFLKGLIKNGLQGDEIVSDIFKSFGVSTILEKEGIRIKKDKQNVREFTFDFTNYPDIAQTIIVCCSAMGIKGIFYGLESLAIKETDRIQALKTELQNLGCNINIINNGTIELNDKINIEPKQVIIHTYNDHRMAMAFAPLALKIRNIIIENPEIVKKSYGKFWEHLSNIGFQFTIANYINK